MEETNERLEVLHTLCRDYVERRRRRIDNNINPIMSLFLSVVADIQAHPHTPTFVTSAVHRYRDTAGNAALLIPSDLLDYMTKALGNSRVWTIFSALNDIYIVYSDTDAAPCSVCTSVFYVSNWHVTTEAGDMLCAWCGVGYMLQELVLRNKRTQHREEARDICNMLKGIPFNLPGHYIIDAACRRGWHYEHIDRGDLDKVMLDIRNHRVAYCLIPDPYSHQHLWVLHEAPTGKERSDHYTTIKGGGSDGR